MKKNFVRFAIVIAIVALVFNVIVFAIPFNKESNSIFWTSYVFGMIAIIAPLALSFYSFKGKELKSKFYGIPVFKMGFIYMVVQLITSLIFIIINSFVCVPNWIVWILYVIILAICAIGFIGADAYRDHVESLEKKTEVKTSFIKGFIVDTQSLANRVTSEPNHSLLAEIADLVKYSDPVTSDALTEIEDEIERKFTLVKGKALNDEDITSDAKILITLINERNDRCKFNK